MCVLIVGSLNMDTTFKLSHLPKKGETILAKSITSNRGGKGQNQAVSAARLGTEVVLVGAVGKDENGRKIKDELKKDGIKTDYILEKNISTGCASIYIDDNGDNNIVVFSGANFALTEEDINNLDKAFENVKYCLLQLEIPLKIVYRTLELCREKGIITILNPAPANPEFNRDYLKYVDYLIPNETELSMIMGKDITDENLIESCRSLLESGCKNILVTLGSKGSVLVNCDDVIFIESNKVNAIDTTAAGDSYIGGFVTSLSKGKSIKASMELGTKVAAKTVTKRGAIDSLPYMGEI